MGQQFRNIVYCADRSGTAKWRKIWPIQSIDCIAQQLNMQVDYSQTPILDQNYYNGLTSVTVQRWISDQHRDIMLKFLKPLSEAKSFAVIFEEDDEMFDGTLLNESKREYLEKKYGDLIQNSIPLYNRGRRAFEGEHVQSNIKAMLNAADFVTVTTDYLKEIYHDFYDVPLENIIAVPNLLPKYLFGDRYEPEKKLKQFSQNKAKPRVGIVSSLSHFNVDNVRQDKDGKAVREVKQKDGTSKWMREDNVEVKLEDTVKITDDFDDIADMVRATVNDFQWVCFGYCPPQIQDLANAGKIECHGGDKIVGIVVFVKFQSLSVNIFERDILFLCVKKSCGIGRSINGSPQHHIEITGKIFLCGVFFNIYGDTAFYLLIIFIRFVGPSSLIDKIVQELLNILKHSLVCALQLGGIDTHTHLKFL